MTDSRNRPPPTPACPVYLDYAATTPVDPEVIEVMTRHLGPDGAFGNPASRFHRFGREAADAVEQARSYVADLIGAEPREIIWTSGATESVNLALKGAAAIRGRGHIVTSAIEHKAVLDSCLHLERNGFEITRIAPAPDGRITLESVRSALRDDTILLSLMHVNNELGTVTDIESVGRLASASGIPFHVDASQSAARLALDVKRVPVDFVSLSGHKMYGPKGVGALYARHSSSPRLEAQIHGGGHERGLRSGTLPTHQIVGMGEAARLVALRRDAETTEIAALEDRFLHGVQGVDRMVMNGGSPPRVAGIVNLRFECVESESLMMAMPGIAISSGSACTSARIEPSHVLRALGLDDETAHTAVRFSIGRFSTRDEMDYAARCVRKAIPELRALSPIWKPPDASHRPVGGFRPVETRFI